MKKDDLYPVEKVRPPSVKDLPKELRPRERIQSQGTNDLKDFELLAVLLRTGTKKMPVMKLAEHILEDKGNLENLFELSFQDFKKIPGIGLAKAAELVALTALAKRWQKEKTKNENNRVAKESITTASQVEPYIRNKISDYNKEHFFVVCLDVRNRVIDVDIISIGILTSSLVHPRETFEIPIRKHSASIMVAHNHPSGDIDPSPEDISITRRLIESGNILGIKVLDHFIFTKTKFISLKEKGII